MAKKPIHNEAVAPSPKRMGWQNGSNNETLTTPNQREGKVMKEGQDTNSILK